MASVRRIARPRADVWRMTQGVCFTRPLWVRIGSGRSDGEIRSEMLDALAAWTEAFCL